MNTFIIRKNFEREAYEFLKKNFQNQMNKIIVIPLVSLFAIALISAIWIATVNVSITVNVLESISPTSIPFSISDGQHQGTCTGGCYPYTINNAANVSLEVNVTYEEGMTVGGYTTNAPFNQTMYPGDNTINFCLTLIGCNSMTVWTNGNIKIART